MNMDVVTLDGKFILNPEFGDQPKMIKKLSYCWVESCIHLFKRFSFIFCRLKQNIILLLRQRVILVTAWLYYSFLSRPQPSLQNCSRNVEINLP